MFDYLYEWIRNAAFYLVLVTALLHIVPESGYQKYIRFFTGLVLVLLLLSPVLKLFGMEGKMEELSSNREYLEGLEQIQDTSDFQEKAKEAEAGMDSGGSTGGGEGEPVEEEAQEEALVEVEEIRIGR